MGIGKASVYKYVPNYFPRDVGAVGGLVGMSRGAGRVLPAAGVRHGRPGDRLPQAAFVALLALTVGSLAWLHLVVVGMKGAEARIAVEPELAVIGR